MGERSAIPVLDSFSFHAIAVHWVYVIEGVDCIRHKK